MGNCLELPRDRHITKSLDMAKKFRVSRTSAAERKFKQALGFYKLILVLDRALIVEIEPKIIQIHFDYMDLIKTLNYFEVAIKETMKAAGVKEVRVKFHAKTILAFTQQD